MKGKTALMAIVVMLMLVAFSPSAFAGCCCFSCPDWLCGCQCVPREDFGQAYKMAVDDQILNPYARNDLTPVEGIDGRAAVNIMKAYIDSFKPQAAPSGGGLTTFAVTQNPGGYAH